MSSKGKCPDCQSTVILLHKKEDRVQIAVRCKCANHPDDVVSFDLERLLDGLEERREVEVYIHKGNSTLH